MRPLYIAGPTGTGKSSVALEVAARSGGEIVNADAYQLYKGLEIVSAAPSVADKALTPHHLFGCLSLAQPSNAGLYCSRATPVLAEICARGVRPIVVGGSGLYLKSLTHGLTDLPRVDAELRAELDEFSDAELVERLRQLDPVGAEQVNLQNRRYVTRALEISILSGRPMSEVKTGWREAEPDIDAVILERPRDQLYARIDARVPQMLAAGLIDEIRALPDPLSDTAEKAIGIRQVRAHLAGESTVDECVAEIQQLSRQYAKRQITWFRREAALQSVCLSEAEGPESAADRILALLPNPDHA
jgi:tRNA dimethylallyltransferase